jgi:hypothetical protein
MTPAEIARDHKNAVKHLRRLGQYRTIAEKTWLRHEASCTPCQLELEDTAEVVCGEGLYLYTRWRTLAEAYALMTGTLVLQ